MPGPAPYVILSTQRVGSHLLGDVLGGHPLFAQAGEVLIPETRKPGSFDSFLDAADSSAKPEALWSRYLSHLQETKPSASHVGFLVKYGHVDRILERDLISDPLFGDVRIIHLTRHNVLRTVASHHLAVARKVHVIRRPMQHDVDTIELPAGTIVESLRKKASSVEAVRARLAERPLVLELAYEDMMDGEYVSEQVLDQLQRFFSVSNAFERKPATTKLAPTELKRLISNYTQIAAAVQNTEFQHMLD